MQTKIMIQISKSEHMQVLLIKLFMKNFVKIYPFPYNLKNWNFRNLKFPIRLNFHPKNMQNKYDTNIKIRIYASTFNKAIYEKFSKNVAA